MKNRWRRGRRGKGGRSGNKSGRQRANGEGGSGKVGVGLGERGPRALGVTITIHVTARALGMGGSVLVIGLRSTQRWVTCGTTEVQDACPLDGGVRFHLDGGVRCHLDGGGESEKVFATATPTAMQQLHIKYVYDYT